MTPRARRTKARIEDLLALIYRNSRAIRILGRLLDTGVLSLAELPLRRAGENACPTLERPHPTLALGPGRRPIPSLYGSLIRSSSWFMLTLSRLTAASLGSGCDCVSASAGEPAEAGCRLKPAPLGCSEMGLGSFCSGSSSGPILLKAIKF